MRSYQSIESVHNSMAKEKIIKAFQKKGKLDIIIFLDNN